MNSSEPVWKTVRGNVPRIARLQGQCPFPRWRWTTLTLAFGLPLVGIVGQLVVLQFRQVAPHVREQVLTDLPFAILIYPFFVAVNFPIFLLYWLVVRRARKGQRVPIVSRWAALIGLAGMYVLGYTAMPFEMTSGAKDAGQGVGVWLGFGAPLFGGLLALVGWCIPFVVEDIRKSIPIRRARGE